MRGSAPSAARPDPASGRTALVAALAVGPAVLPCDRPRRPTPAGDRAEAGRRPTGAPARRLALSCLLALLAAGPAPADPAAPRFEPVPLPEHVYEGGWEHFVGGGVAVLDCDGDRLPELYAAGGANPAALMRNRGGMRFEEATPEALALTGVVGAYPLDLDGDGRLDLAVLRVGPDALLRGGPDCAFAPFEAGPFADPGLAGGDRWTTAFSATWEEGRTPAGLGSGAGAPSIDAAARAPASAPPAAGPGPRPPAAGSAPTGRATLPTLAFGHYVDRADPEGPFGACDANRLHRPEGAAYGAPIALPGHCALSMLFTDWGRRGRADLRVSNDRHYYVSGGQEQMWAMEPAPRPYGPEDGWRPHALWGMGIASRDLSGDGLPEVYLTSMGDQRLQALEPDAAGPSYADEPFERGATAHRPHTGGDGRPSTGWHPAFGDVDLDGRDDLFVSKGNVEQMPGLAMDDPDSLLMQREDGTFEERSVEAGVASMARGRGAALVDLDLDGRLDLVVVQRRAPMLAYRNVTAAPGAWVAIALEQPGPNWGAVDAWIEVEAGDRRWSREVTVGGGHAGGVAGPEHFGFGDAREVRGRVIWPDGAESDWAALELGRYVTLRRGEGAALGVETW